jgi:outer membrane lipoprotein-sorting protein
MWKTAFSISLAAILGVWAVLWCTPCAAGARPAPRVPATRPADERDSALTRIEECGKTLRSLAADFTQDTFRPLIGEREVRVGDLKILKPQFLRIVWRQPTDEKAPKPPGGAPLNEIVYDGQVFIEVKHDTKQVIKWTIRKQPSAAGAGQPKLDAGPFKLLGGIRADELRRDYDVSLLDVPADDRHFRFHLVPKHDEERVEYTRIEAWIDRGTLTPATIMFVKPNAEVETWTLVNAKINDAVAPKDFEVAAPRGWNVLVDPAGRMGP